MTTKKKSLRKINKKKLKLETHPTTDPSHLDVHRVIARMDGGEYHAANVKVMTPVDHMTEHDNLRIRSSSIQTLKAMIDDRRQIIMVKTKISNQLKANDRGTDHLSLETREFLTEMLALLKSRVGKLGRNIEKYLKTLELPIIDAALKIPSVGALSVATLIAYYDINKATNASKMWAYAGYHKASHERHQKNEVASDGHKTVRAALYNLGSSFIRGKNTAPNAYVDIYYNEKEKLASSQKITKTRVTGGRGVVEKKWCDVSDGHRDGAAKRKMLKHFLADLWYVWRTLEGLSTRPLYVEEKLGHTGIIKPEERGWVYLENTTE